jgi:hypothetical protein
MRKLRLGERRYLYKLEGLAWFQVLSLPAQISEGRGMKV